MVVAAGILCVGWSDATIRYVAWSAVDFFPPDLARQVRRHHLRYDAGIRRGVAAPPAWRSAHPGSLPQALRAQVSVCVDGLNTPIPLDDLVEEVGVLAVRVLDANDPLAVAHDDPREVRYARDYAIYVDSVRGRLRLVYYGPAGGSRGAGGVETIVDDALLRSRDLYPFVGAEFFRSGSFRSWQTFDDRSVAFGVAAVSLSRAMTDLANLARMVWGQGGGLVPPPVPTPRGHVGPTVIPAPLEGGFPGRERESRGRPVMPRSEIVLPPP
jgi:hypothetical protein